MVDQEFFQPFHLSRAYCGFSGNNDPVFYQLKPLLFQMNSLAADRIQNILFEMTVRSFDFKNQVPLLLLRFENFIDPFTGENNK